MTDRRVLMVALDGLDISVLEKAFAAGRLPNLKAFADASKQLRVNSDGERLEGTVWPTFATGTGPGVHGHHWFYQWIAEESSFVPATDSRLATIPFWKGTLNEGRRVTVFDIAYQLPTGHQNERIYTGWGLQDEMDQHASPPDFKREIRNRHGRSKVEKDTLLVNTPDDRLKLARKLRAGARQRSRVLLDLAQRSDWELLIFGFGEFHLSGHHLSMPTQLSPKVNNEQAMVGILQPLDDAWPEILRALGPDTEVVLFALHGMQPKFSYSEAVERVVDELQGKATVAPPADDLLRKIRNVMPEDLHRAIWLRMPASFRFSRMMEAKLRGMDVATDRAFVLEGDCAVAVRVNVRGREKHGVVAQEEMRGVLAELWAELQRYRTENGEPPFVEMAITADRFQGPRVDMLPDAMVIYNPKVARTRALTRDDGHVVRLTHSESRNGIHTGRGFCFYRPAGDVAVKRDDIDNLDFAPTVLERLGVTPPGRLEGTPFV